MLSVRLELMPMASNDVSLVRPWNHPSMERGEIPPSEVTLVMRVSVEMALAHGMTWREVPSLYSLTTRLSAVLTAPTVRVPALLPLAWTSR